MNERELLALATKLTAEAGQAAPLGLERLTGGKNNRVYRVVTGDRPLVLKLYHHDARDTRDRLGAEWDFLHHVWARGVTNVPQPLARDRETHAGLYGFVPGRKLTASEIDLLAVGEAAVFVDAINDGPHDVETLKPGSEACFSLRDHLATIERRVARLADIDRDAPFADEAIDLVATRLKPLWADVRAGIEASAAGRSIALDAPIARPCVSPSDFGFHNALVDGVLAVDGTLSFIDFEYAGRDDPAKLVGDFFSQPEVPVPPAFLDAFLGAIEPSLRLDEADLWRCEALIPAYRIKWVCIILNEFLALGASRRAFADDGEREARARRQIERAERHLAFFV